MTDVHTREPGVSLDHQREAATLAALEKKPGFDIADIPDEDFDQRLQKITVRQLRMQRILDTVLKEDVHYGNPKDRDNKPVFKKPMLYQAGAEELRQFFRLTLRHMDPPAVVQSKEYVSVQVTLGIFDSAGRLLGVRSGNCNSLEKRFQKSDGKNYIYTDAREMLHNCLSMAEKRAGTFVTREATGATGFFSAEEEMEKALSTVPGETPPEPWTDLDKKMVYARAAKIGVKTGEDFATFAKEALGREDVSFIGAADVETLLRAIEAKKQGDA